MPQKYLASNKKALESVVSEARSHAVAKDACFVGFVEHLYLPAPKEFIQKSSAALLAQIAVNMWRYVKLRKPSESHRLRVYNPELKTHGYETARTVIEFSAKDSPFLLDSMLAAITRLGHRVHEVLHPIIPLQRNEKGEITALYSSIESAAPGSVKESVMHFQISHLALDEDIRKLEDELNQVMQFVRLCVEDWKRMRLEMEKILRHLTVAKLPIKTEELEEARDFLSWLINDNFIFMGYRHYRFKDMMRNIRLEVDKQSEMGILRAKSSAVGQVGLSALPPKSLKALTNPVLLEVTKSSRRSIVHRPVHMDYIDIKEFDEAGNVIGEFRFLGMFTSAAYFQSTSTIPIIRKKMQDVIERSGFLHNSHNGKALRAVLEGYPRDELLQSTPDELFAICMGIVQMYERPSVRLFVRQDRFNRFVSCMVFIPRERFNTELRKKIQTILERGFDGSMTDYYTQVSDSPLARLHILIKTNPASKIASGGSGDIKAMEQELYRVTNSWTDSLHELLEQRLGERDAETLFRDWVGCFTDAYKDQYDAQATYIDIMKSRQVLESDKLALDFYARDVEPEDAFNLKLYHPDYHLTLSQVLPTLENMGFHVVDERTYVLRPKASKKEVWLHHFRITLGEKVADRAALVSRVKQELEATLFRVWYHQFGNDLLNALIASAEFTAREIELLRTYAKYICQTDLPYSRSVIIQAVIRYPAIAKLLVQQFMLRFDPAQQDKNVQGKKNAAQRDALDQQMELALGNIQSLAEDRIIRQFHATIDATLRTNFFQRDAKGKPKPVVSIKLDPKRVPNLPKPHPFAEIFVYSYETEGVHLRGGKVARGGLRWSDRVDDFRTEVLGLMKAQMIKNTVIVPTGSKGGFVVKHPVDRSNRDAFLQQGIACYRLYLSGLLDITDNMDKGKVIPPKDVVRHDGDDPYLVVAADKGTATFSDIANDVAKSYGFWLGDAFASGGSAGYDHKDMGITARGAWVSVKRHFLDMGIDVQKDPITVVGIGDMSGDVFGNGMLLSKAIKLLAAFDHRHIFVDPNPKPDASYKERKRLYDLPRSSWADYSKALISKGGAVFERGAKSLTLTSEIQKCFGIKEKNLSPEEFLKRILTAEYDLLWNGGIGTFVKASTEAHEQVGDKTNDAIRVNANQLHCKVVGEGGNLGFTQRARIEFSDHGGRINTDFIDNVAGVNTSDHEVNIKIALKKVMNAGKLTLKKRDALLESMTEEVAELVLQDNRLQAEALTVCERQSALRVESDIRLMHRLEESGLLDRKLEGLPDDEALLQRQAMGKGLTRPEIAVLFGYSKMFVFNDLVNSNVPEDTYLNEDLIAYFPHAMHALVKNYLSQHELRREIIVNLITNSIVNRMGPHFFFHVMEDTGVKGCDVARAYVITRDLFGLEDLWQSIEALGSTVDADTQMQLLNAVEHLMQRTVFWLLRNCPQPLDVKGIIAYYRPKVTEMYTHLERVVSAHIRTASEALSKTLRQKKVPDALVKKIAALRPLESAMDVAFVAKKLPVKMTAEVYFSLGTTLEFEWLRGQVETLPAQTYWQRLAMKTMIEQLYDQQMRLAADIITAGCNAKSCSGAMDAWVKQHQKHVTRYGHFIQDLKRHDALDAAMLSVALQRVETLLYGA